MGKLCLVGCVPMGDNIAGFLSDGFDPPFGSKSGPLKGAHELRYHGDILVYPGWRTPDVSIPHVYLPSHFWFRC